MQALFTRLAADLSTLHSTLNLKLIGFTAHQNDGFKEA
jgi:hypothetical protein